MPFEHGGSSSCSPAGSYCLSLLFPRILVGQLSSKMAFLHSTGGSNPPKYSDKDHDDDAVQQEEEEPLLHQVASRGKSKSRQRFFMKFGLKHWLAINLLLTSLNLAGLITLNILWRTGQQQPAATASQAASCSCPETTDHQHETLLPPCEYRLMCKAYRGAFLTTYGFSPGD